MPKFQIGKSVRKDIETPFAKRLYWARVYQKTGWGNIEERLTVSAIKAPCVQVKRPEHRLKRVDWNRLKTF
ncbi:hypothetical protein AVO42_06715 [Thiomicrospira sp. XS5]|nr:hypothetical protein AVO42_06715 [Thiomicrospira sp. XS5]